MNTKSNTCAKYTALNFPTASLSSGNSAKNSLLEELFIETNTRITSLPSSFKTLRNLQKITYKYYQMGQDYEETICLPLAFCQLEKLTYLEFCTNRNIVILGQIGRLSHTLQTLKIECYTLKEIPLEIMQLTKLKELTISLARITKIPDEICQLTQLENLYLYGNRIRHIPKTLGRLKKLKNLNLSANCLSISETKKLAKLLPNTEIEYSYQHP